MNMLKGGPIGAVGTAKSFMNVVKDIDFEDARKRAEQVPSVLVLAHAVDNVQDAANRLFGENDRNGVVARTWEDAEPTFDPTRYDVVIVYDPEERGIFNEVQRIASSRKDATNIVSFSGKLGKDVTRASDVRFEIMEMLPDMAPAFGRFHPLWRKAAVDAIIDQTARANGQFALVSNIPAAIPFLGGMIAAGADLIVLTKNQVMMCYKIAAVHDQDLGNHIAILRELAPVVGAGFLWRTAAREASSFVPFAAGTIPKVLIAYSGSFAMGKAADLYYQHGVTPSRNQIELIRKQGMKLASKVPTLRDYVSAPDDEVVDAITSSSDGHQFNSQNGKDRTSDID